MLCYTQIFTGYITKLLKIMTVLGKLGFSVELAGFHAFSSPRKSSVPSVLVTDLN